MHNDGTLITGRRTCTALLAFALAAAPGVAQQPEQPADEQAEGPRACLSHPTIRRTKVLDDRNIVFMTRDEAIYRNQLPETCTGLRRNSLVNYGIANRRMCAGDSFQVLWETTPGNFTPSFVCQLGTFIPISEAELEDLTAMTAPTRERRSQRRSSREAVTTEQVELPPEAPAAETTPAAPAEPPPVE